MIKNISMIVVLSTAIVLSGCEGNPGGTALAAGAAGLVVGGLIGASINRGHKNKHHRDYGYNRYHRHNRYYYY